MYSEEELNDLCFYDKKTKIITIRMDKIFDREDIAYMNEFKIKNRSYYNILYLIVEDIKLIINEYPEFLLTLMELKYEFSINEEKENSKEIILKKIDEFLDDDDFFIFIDEYVDNNYTLDLDSKLKSNNNDECVINDEKNKIILKTSIVARLLIPIISEIGFKETDIYLLFVNLLKRFDSDTENTINKLYKFIELRVHRTIYSDKVIWNFLRSRSIDPTIYDRYMIKSIIVSIIAKLAHNKSAVSYLDVVIKEKISFSFKYNYSINIKSIKTTDEENEEREKLSVFMLKKDIGELYLEQVAMEEEVKNIKIPKKYEYLNDISNPYVSKFLINFYDNKFNAIFAEGELRTKLILKMRKELLDWNYELLPEILISELSENEKRFNNRKKLNQSIISSKKYKYFLEDYKSVIGLIEKTNPILSLISLRNYKFVNHETGEEIKLNLEVLAGEILDLINLIN